MKCPWFAAAIAAVLLVPASAGTLFAGVVMAETSTAHDANGKTFSVDKTIYVQGNKQKVERKDLTTVTDLDKSVIYIIDKNARVYTETPLQVLSPAQPQSETIQLSKTGETRVIAHQPCDEYRSIEGNKLEWVTISLCVSTGAPGAKEVTQFENKIDARLSGVKSERSARDETASLMLEKKSVLSFLVPDPSSRQSYRTASLVVATRVNKIQLETLSPETFKPPTGYSKLRNSPSVAPDSIKALDETINDIALNLPSYSRAWAVAKIVSG
jgi:hypothetical protein